VDCVTDRDNIWRNRLRIGYKNESRNSTATKTTTRDTGTSYTCGSDKIGHDDDYDDDNDDSKNKK
jgi:hypothetical protein